jgi:para-nitrobenzyl esterase
MRLVIMGLLAMTLWSSPAMAGPIVQTQSGAIEGAEAPGVEYFKGIPFAAPPVGPLRWRAPQAPAAWQGVRKTIAFSKDCHQEPQAEPPGPGFNNPMSEDCLYLNIWRPKQKSAKPLPVMVWIYGGAFIMGAGSFPSYDGSNFARGGVVLVTFNYRLGRLGFFAHPALSREQANEPTANYGLMDQIAVLRWVRANIAAFGGDARNVTIFGESAGAASVNYLMTSPLARGLFDKAIAESGGSGSNLKSLAEAEAVGKAWADSKGAGDLASLRALPVETVWDGPVTTTSTQPIDGRLLVMPQDKAFDSGAVAQVPYMAGSNSREESLLRWLPDYQLRWLKGLGDKGPPLLALYRAEEPDEKRAAAKAWGEFFGAVPARAKVRAIAAHGGKAFLYRYGYVPDAAKGAVSGAGHDAEMEMVFANPDLRWHAPWSARDAAMARTMQSHWINFATSGDPNGAGLPAWPAYDAKDAAQMNFGPGDAKAQKHYNRQRLDAIEAAHAEPF